MIDAHTHMCLERVRPLGSCLVTFPDSFTAQEGWRGGGRKWLQRLSFFFFSLRQDLSQHQILSVSAVRASPHSMSRSEDSSPTGNRAEQGGKTIQLMCRQKNNVHRAKLPFIASLKPVYTWFIKCRVLDLDKNTGQMLYSVSIQSSAYTKTDMRGS